MSSEELIEKTLMQAASEMADFDSAKIERSGQGATFYELAQVAFRVFEQAQAETTVTAEGTRVLGPGVIATAETPGENGSVINWGGVNYIPQPEPAPADKCGRPAKGGPCVLPRGHNTGHLDVPSNHRAAPTDERECPNCSAKPARCCPIHGLHSMPHRGCIL